MAENNGGKVDQGKVKQDAENIAGGAVPKTPAHSPTSVPDGTVPPPKTPNTETVTGKANPGPGVVTQSNPGAAKPGAGNQGTGNQAGNQTPDPKSAATNQRAEIEAQYGPGAVQAEKVDADGQPTGQTQTFSKRAWDLLGPMKPNGTKDGWRPAVEEPEEVKNLRNKKNQGANP
jgi:hypothetical protein